MLKAAATNPILDESSVLIDVLSRVGSYPDRIRIAAARSLRKWSRKIRFPRAHKGEPNCFKAAAALEAVLSPNGTNDETNGPR